MDGCQREKAGGERGILELQLNRPDAVVLGADESLKRVGGRLAAGLSGFPAPNLT